MSPRSWSPCSPAPRPAPPGIDMGPFINALHLAFGGRRHRQPDRRRHLRACAAATAPGSRTRKPGPNPPDGRREAGLPPWGWRGSRVDRSPPVAGQSAVTSAGIRCSDRPPSLLAWPEAIFGANGGDVGHPAHAADPLGGRYRHLMSGISGIPSLRATGARLLGQMRLTRFRASRCRSRRGHGLRREAARTDSGVEGEVVAQQLPYLAQDARDCGVCRRHDEDQRGRPVRCRDLARMRRSCAWTSYSRVSASKATRSRRRSPPRPMPGSSGTAPTGTSRRQRQTGAKRPSRPVQQGDVACVRMGCRSG